MHRLVFSLALALALLFATAQADAPLDLTLGETFLSWTAKGLQRVYHIGKSQIYFPPSSANYKIEYWVTVTPFSGDPDLAVGTSAAINYTDPSTYKLSENTESGDAARLTADNFGNATDLYIAVYGYTNCNYTVSVSRRVGENGPVTENTVVVANEGIPMMLHLDPVYSDTGFFVYETPAVASTGNVTISTVPTSYFDFVCVSTTTQYPQSREQCNIVYSYAYTYWLPISFRYTPSTKYYVAVSASEDFADNNITVTVTRQGQPGGFIPEDLPLSAAVAVDQYMYYTFYLSTNQSFAIHLVALDGDADLYVSRTNHLPTEGHATWTSSHLGNDVVEISPTDPNFGLGYYYVGVHGFSGSPFGGQYAYYYIQVGANDDTQTLEAFRRGWTTCESQGQYRYFKIFDGDIDYSDLHIDANVYDAPNASAYLYVSSHISRPTSDAGKYEFNATAAGNNSLVIPKHWQDPSYYYIGVQCQGSKFPYNVSVDALLIQDPIEVSVAQPAFWVYVPRGYYRWFYYRHESNTTDLADIAVVSEYGDPDVFALYGTTTLNVSFWSFPSKWHFDAASTSLTGHDVVSLSGLSYGQYVYFSVYGYTQSGFDATVLVPNATTPLREATPVNGAVAYSQYSYFSYQIPAAESTASDVTISVDVTRGFVDLYVSTDPKVPHPTATTADYVRESWDSSMELILPRDSSGTYYIGIYGADVFENATFTVQVSTSRMWVEVDEQPSMFMIAAGSRRQFQVAFSGSISSALEVVVTGLSGRTAVYASNDPANMYPDAGNATISSTSYPSHAFFIAPQKTAFNESTPMTMTIAANTDCFGILCADARVTISVRSLEESLGITLAEEMPQFATNNGLTNMSYLYFRMFAWDDGALQLKANVYHGAIGGIFAAQGDCWAIAPDEYPTASKGVQYFYTPSVAAGSSAFEFTIPNYVVKKFCLLVSVQIAEDTSFDFSYAYTGVPQINPVIPLSSTSASLTTRSDPTVPSYFSTAIPPSLPLLIDVDICSGDYEVRKPEDWPLPIIVSANVLRPNASTPGAAIQKNATGEMNLRSSLTIPSAGNVSTYFVAIDGMQQKVSAQNPSSTIFAAGPLEFSVRARPSAPGAILATSNTTFSYNHTTPSSLRSPHLRTLSASAFAFYTLKFTPVNSSRLQNASAEVTYRVYASAPGVRTANIVTACGCALNGNAVAVVTATLASPKLGDTEEVEIVLPRSSGNALVGVNIVATDMYGDQVAYSPVFIPVTGKGGSSSAGIIIGILVVVAVLAYVAGGYVYHSRKHGRTGLEALPNIRIWSCGKIDPEMDRSFKNLQGDYGGRHATQYGATGTTNV